MPEWSGLVPEIVFKNVEKPLFSYFRVPFANDIDLDSPLGVSVYARAVDLIRQADEQWARIEWEYESKETALDVSQDMIKENGLPKRKNRIYRKYDVDSLDGNFYNIFSPEIRDSAQFNYFNRILQRIEFNCGLAYGTLSDPQTVEKTAEEIRTSKQRSYTQVSAIQRNLETAINDLFYAVSVYAKIGSISSENAEIVCTWGDSVLEDTDKEFQRRLQMVSAGLLSKEKFISWYFHCDENQAGEYIPQADALFGGM
ncbi:MAG: phage portal protein [Muribaculaceae bacterium]|nr:phage portal protein [Alistipes senegalensis]MCM1474369.1 phage portal protein [Muribaculaceae bacterium]